MKNIFVTKGLTLLFGVLLSLSACVDLDEEPRGFASPDNFYNSITQAEAVLAGHMNSLFYEWNDGYGWAWRFFRDTDQINGGNLNLDYKHGEEMWKSNYRSLLYINTLIKAVNAGRLKDASPEEINMVIGQAKLMRAYDYFGLVRLYGDVPLYTDEMEDPAINPIARTPIKEVYEFIISDLTDAIAKLPLSWPQDKIGRPTKGAAKGLLAKVYLTMATAPLNETANYAKARDIAKSCIDDQVHNLVPNIFDVFRVENKYSQEMMWSFNANYKDFSTHANIFAPSEIGGWNSTMCETRMDSTWVDQPRKKAYMLTEIYKVKQANGSVRNLAYIPDGATVLDTIHWSKWATQKPTIRKWLPPNVLQADYDNYVNVYNIPIMRYADVLLMYAEAANMANGGPTPDAVNALNRVIDRANGNSTGLPGHPRAEMSWTAKQFDDAVIMERHWELCFEYDRWFDICRKRILDSDFVTPKYKRQNYSAEDYLWPIPYRDLKLNPLLEQNPGYPSGDN